MSRSVLVTGASGFLGRHLVDALRAQGDLVWGTRTRLVSPGCHEAGRDERPPLRWIHADMTASGTLDNAVSLARPDLVFHLAGGRRVSGDALDRVNVEGVEALLRAIAGPGRASGAPARARVVVAGSAAEYGAVPEAALPIREDGPLHPVDDYGRSKAEATRRALELADRLAVDVVVARIFNATGPGEPFSLMFGRVAFEIASAERTSCGSAAAEIAVGSLRATRDLIDVRDASRALLLVAERAERGIVVNVGRGVEERVRDHVERLVARSRVPVSLMEPPASEPPRPTRHVADVSRLGALGFQTEVTLEASARDLLEEARSRPLGALLDS